MNIDKNIEIPIDRNIEIPLQNRGGKDMKLLKKMEVGDSILLSTTTNANRFTATARINGYKVTRRTLEVGVRVWLLEMPNAL